MDDCGIAIVGGGFSGTMVAVNCARIMPPQIKITLIERAQAGAGLGVAYGTTDPQHLLNVRAQQMGAFADDAGDFWQWLQKNSGTHGLGTVSAGQYVPRMVYGKYLQDILRETCAAHSNLSVVTDTITDIEKQDEHFLLSGTEKYKAGQVVLALGNFPPGEHDAENPYASEVRQRLAETGDVLIIGTGLTSLDLVMSLARTKPDGVIHVLSRRGLLPRLHGESKTYPPFLDKSNLPRTALQLYCTVKAEIRKAAAQGLAWQDVIDAMRPLNQDLWQSLNEVEQKRFLHHLRPYWDVHRHRCAPEVMTVCQRMMEQGRLILHRGPIVAHDNRADGIHVTWRPRGEMQTQTFIVQHIVNCTGPQMDIRKLDDALVKNMLARNLIAPDALRMGIATGAHNAVLNKKNEPVRGLYALGSLLRGRLFETVAVRELRLQAAEVAGFIRDRASP